MLRRSKLRITIVLEMDTGDAWEQNWPGCNTLEDVARMQQKLIDDGTYDMADLLYEDAKITVEPIHLMETIR